MRHFSLGLVAATLLSSTAVAADLPVKAFAPLPPPPSWSGFYVGLNGGYSFGSASYNQAGGFTSTAFGSNFPLYSTGHNSLKGALAGVQAGYNWQVSNRWLFGLEADWQWSGQRGDNRNCTPFATLPFFGAGADGFGYCLASEQRITDLGTARLRAGAIVRDSVWYLTGGAAWGTVKDQYALTSTANPTIFPPPAFNGLGPIAGAGSFSNHRWGWTVGAGVETMLWGNWSAKLEYLHVDLGGVNDVTGLVPNAAFGPALTGGFNGNTTTQAHITDDLVRVGLNYRFNGRPLVARY
jgi:outer membrane immunogenic protein